MSYPPPKYDGEPGLVNARLRRAGSEPEVRYKNGGTAEYLATGESTGGQFGLYRWNMSAAKSGPGPALPPDDLGVVLRARPARSGCTTARRGSTPSRATSCSCPEGGIHGFRNESGEPPRC